jgi:hypothetical protein
MEDVVSQTKAEYNKINDRLKLVFSHTPDDKLNWSPSPTARTPVEIVAHCASAVTGVMGMLRGKPFAYTSTEQFDSVLRQEEKAYKTREQVLAALDESSREVIAWLDSLTPEQVSSTVSTFFGEFPMSFAITIPTEHTQSHIPQLEYLQTIWGDRVWRM